MLNMTAKEICRVLRNSDDPNIVTLIDALEETEQSLEGVREELNGYHYMACDGCDLLAEENSLLENDKLELENKVADLEEEIKLLEGVTKNILEGLALEEDKNSSTS